MQLPLRALSFLALITAGVLAYTATPAEAGDGGNATARRLGVVTDLSGTTGCADTIPSAPVLMMTTSGSTLAGPYMTSLTVYSDGLVLMSEAIGISGSSAAAQTRISAETVQGLERDLREAGAFRICDQVRPVADLPLTTVTVFADDASSTSHTYSYWIGSTAQQSIGQIINDFVLLEVL